ncbi:MAG: hypothetical protein KDA80_20260 [Planctomycetaceae bacterium]|nr:hypothetical protein [Planctomycetaceae bacterium]
MICRRCFAVLLVLGGGILTLSGMAANSYAVDPEDCDPAPPYGPAECLPAHQRPPRENDPGFNPSCEIGSWWQCQPSEFSDCGQVDGYGSPMSGYCYFDWSEGSQAGCIDEASFTVLALHHHQSACEFFEGTCQCVWILDTHPVVPFGVCDCEDYTFPEYP